MFVTKLPRKLQFKIPTGKTSFGHNDGRVWVVQELKPLCHAHA